MKINKICPVCRSGFTTKRPDIDYCSINCFIDSFTIPGHPKEIILDPTPCKLWRGDLIDDKPVIVFNDTVINLREYQLPTPEGKRLNLDCGNHYCVNKNHYSLVDDLTMFGYL